MPSLEIGDVVRVVMSDGDVDLDIVTRVYTSYAHTNKRYFMREYTDDGRVTLSVGYSSLDPCTYSIDTEEGISRARISKHLSRLLTCEWSDLSLWKLEKIQEIVFPEVKEEKKCTVKFKPVSEKVREIRRMVDAWPDWKKNCLGDNFARSAEYILEHEED